MPAMLTATRSRRALIACLVATALMSVPVAATAAPALLSPTIPVPPPEPGSFFTAFTYTPHGRVVAFDGFTVFVQQRRSSELTEIGSLPEQYRGATDPSFVAASPDGRTLLLGAGGGGSEFPDERFNGNIFAMPASGGTAELVGTFPFSIVGVFHGRHRFVFGQGETFGLFTGSVEVLDLRTRTARSIIANIPGDPGGITFDRRGNLYVGLGAGQDLARTGEIRRFPAADVRAALRGETVLDFDADSTLLNQILGAGSLATAPGNRLFVGGGDFVSGDLGYVAELSLVDGTVIRTFDPATGEPSDDSEAFYALQFTRVGCRLGALDLISFFDQTVPDVIHQIRVCRA